MKETRNKKRIIGIVLIAIGAIGFIGIPSTEDVFSLIIGSIFFCIIGAILIFFDKFKVNTDISSERKKIEILNTAITQINNNQKEISGEEENHIKNEISDSSFYFPETDENGNKLLKVYELTLSGIKKSYNGVKAQDTIKYLYINEQVFLYAIPNNKYDDSAVLVLDYNDEFIGWLPIDPGDLSTMNLKDDVFRRIIDGHTVLARVSNIEEARSNSELLICTIEIARYAKPRKTKSSV